MQLVRPSWCRFCRECSRPLADPAATADLIAFLQALPEGRKSRGVRYPQWLLLLMAILGILSGCRSARDLERFAKRHHQAFGAALGLELPKAPCDSILLYLFERVELEPGPWHWYWFLRPPHSGALSPSLISTSEGFREQEAVLPTSTHTDRPR